MESHCREPGSATRGDSWKPGSSAGGAGDISPTRLDEDERGPGVRGIEKKREMWDRTGGLLQL